MTQTVDIDEIQRPTQSVRLHPHEEEPSTLDGEGNPLPLEELREIDEDERTGFDEFRLTIGDEPEVPPKVTERDDDIILVDGDRRIRALEENGVSEVEVDVTDDELSDEEIDAISVKLNKQRESNNPEREARKAAMNVMPWLIAPGERRYDVSGGEVRRMSLSEWGETVGVTKQNVSQKISRHFVEKSERALLAKTLADMSSGYTPSAEQVEMIDETVHLLLHGNGDGVKVVANGMVNRLVESLGDIETISIAEIRDAAERAVEEGMNYHDFIDYVEKAYVSVPEEPDIASEAEQMDTKRSDYEEKETDYEEPETVNSVDGFFDVDGVGIEDVFDDEDFKDGSMVEIRRIGMVGEPIEGTAASIVKGISEKHDIPVEQVMKEFVEPAIIEAAVDRLSD